MRRRLGPLLDIVAFEIRRLLAVFHTVVLRRYKRHLDFGALVLRLGRQGLSWHYSLDLGRVSRRFRRLGSMRWVCLEEPLLLMRFFPSVEAVPAVPLHEKRLALPLKFLLRNSRTFVGMVTLVIDDLWLVKIVDLLLRD